MPGANVGTRRGGQKVDPDAPQARRRARTTRVMCVRRNVRTCTPDLVRCGAAWASKSRAAPVALGEASTSSSSVNGLVISKEWARATPERLAPRYSDASRKRLDLPSGVQPETNPAAASNLNQAYGLGLGFSPSMSSSTSGGSGMNSPGLGPSGFSSSTGSTAPGGLSAAPSAASSLSSGSARTLVDHGSNSDSGDLVLADFKSLTDARWGQFENMGFGRGGAGRRGRRSR
jgi:hypothetical protein